MRFIQVITLQFHGLPLLVLADHSSVSCDSDAVLGLTTAVASLLVTSEC